MKHLSFEKIIEVSENTEKFTQEEMLHIESCTICKRRLEAALMMGPALKKTFEIDHLIDLSSAEKLADNAFNMVMSEKNSHKRSKTVFFSVASGIAAAVIAILAFSVIKKDNAVPDNRPDELSEKAIVAEVIEPENTDVSIDDELQGAEIDIATGVMIKRKRSDIKAIKDSRIVCDNENYYTVKKGVVEFKVESGSDFIVNLNNIALVRVLGTVFTVSVQKNKCSVAVTEGLVEIIDLERGAIKSVAKGEKGSVLAVRKKVAENKHSSEKLEEISPPDNSLSAAVSEVPEIKSRKPERKSNSASAIEDPDMIHAMIKDLETTLDFSHTPAAQLHELFGLYRKTGRWGTIIGFWKTKSEVINSQNNPFLREMHFTACEASINLYLYDNKVCKRYRALYPEGPDPQRMEDHLKMAW